MKTIVWPAHQLSPIAQVEIGKTAKPLAHASQFLKYGCSIRSTGSMELKGRRTRKRVKVSIVG